MIFESYFWKKELEKHIRVFKEKMSQKRWFEASFAKVELAFFNSAYIIRKLIEARKLTTALERQQITLLQFLKKNTAPATDLRNRHDLDRLYDLDSPKKSQLTLKDLAHRVIHSYVYEIQVNESGGLDGFYFTSDHDKDKYLYFLTLRELLKLLELISDDWPSRVEMVRDPKTGDFRITNS